MQAIDLHVHSNRSDGTLSPAQLVDYAIEKGLKAFALTDHDTVDGLDEAIQYAERLRELHSEPGSSGKRVTVIPSNSGGSVPKVIPGSSGDMVPKAIPGNSGGSVPEVIPGIELSTDYLGRDVHIVGLYIDYHNEAFRATLQGFLDSRMTKNRKMCALLQEAGIPVTYEELLAEFPDAVITRAHYAKYMLNHGYIRNIKEAFERYIGDYGPCFVPREKITPAQAVRLIRDVHGIPVLAHPLLYHLNDRQLDSLVVELKEAGLLGLEAFYSTHSPSEERQMRSLAQKHGLLISGGSDFHGSNKPGLDLGVGYGKLFVPCSLLEEIQRAAISPLSSDS